MSCSQSKFSLSMITKPFVILLFCVIIYFILPSNYPVRSIIQIPLGLMLSLFLPGFTLYSSLFPDKLGILNLERLIFSFGLSFILLPLITILLNFSPQGITETTVVISLIGFSIITSITMTAQKYRHKN